jgi:hypothetical protein
MGEIFPEQNDESFFPVVRPLKTHHYCQLPPICSKTSKTSTTFY